MTHLRANLTAARKELRLARKLEKSGAALPLGQDVKSLEAICRLTKHLLAALENNEGLEGFTRRLRRTIPD